uniref:Uncharacterized protein n=1 Tax=Trichobilharzia regenti TaxID=157069 RepID=A0AA85JDL4_TRIRE|nr:unnamed protein product [Trichobilharzia regenti]
MLEHDIESEVGNASADEDGVNKEGIDEKKENTRRTYDIGRDDCEEEEVSEDQNTEAGEDVAEEDDEEGEIKTQKRVQPNRTTGRKLYESDDDSEMSGLGD